MNPHEELFHRLLDESSSLLAAPESDGIAIPDDELHREIIVPLLPAMLADAAIRGHWNEQHATGFVARIARHFENGDPAPRWTPADFEIHVTASYSAGPDARALADTLLSEESLREMTAALMNQLLDVLWPVIAPASGTPQATLEIEVVPAAEIAAPIVPPEPEPAASVVVEIIETIAVSATEPAKAVESPSALQTQSRALIRSLCRELSASAMQRGFVACRASDLSATILARRILQRAEAESKLSRPTSPPRRFPRRASL